MRPEIREVKKPGIIDKFSVFCYIYNMISIAEEVKRLVRASPFLEEGLSRGLINYSALAREMRTDIETTLHKSVSESSILMALKRLAEKMRPTFQSRIQRQFLEGSGNLTVRPNLVGFTYTVSTRLIKHHKRLMDQIPDQGHYLTITHGVTETTVLVSAHLEGMVTRIFPEEDMIQRTAGLSALVIKFTMGAVSTPGIHYPIFLQLAWNNINVIEVISTYQELILVMEKGHVNRAFQVLMDFLACE